MSREQSYNSIILKKSAFAEADEIITVLTKENGKMRFLAKSIKLSKSKLQNSLQLLFVCNLRIVGTGSKIHKIIGAEVLENFLNLRLNLSAVKAAFAASEIVIKFLPDEEPSPGVFSLLKIFLEFLSKGDIEEKQISIGLLCFKIKFLELVGFGIKYSPNFSSLFFDSSKGGFMSNQSSLAMPVKSSALNLFLLLKEASFKVLPTQEEGLLELHILVDGFLEYQLERELKAEKTMRGVV